MLSSEKQVFLQVRRVLETMNRCSRTGPKRQHSHNNLSSRLVYRHRPHDGLQFRALVTQMAENPSLSTQALIAPRQCGNRPQGLARLVLPHLA